ncbi:MAG: hypothetical protein QHH80_12775 [Anaerolineae bacterium]|nr:hypothetical protein [Anaerolineae bacterium]
MFPNPSNAWREILERIFEGFQGQENVTPEWLVNPETGRRLKLDRYYPDAGVAFRFVGSTGKRKAPVSEQELAEEAHRDAIRESLCQQAGVHLITIDLYEAEPRKVLEEIRTALSRSARLLAQSDRPQRVKADLTQRLAKARQVCDRLAPRVRSHDDLTLYAQLWEDRQYMRRDEPAASTPQGKVDNPFAVGMQVEHERFGAGRVVDVREDASGGVIKVQFADGSERTFLLHLVVDKMRPRG